MLLKNVTQDIVFETLEDMLKKTPDACRCEKCRLDVAAIALNNLPPRYVVSDRGEVFERVSGLSIQIAADTTGELTKALRHVTANPRHAEHSSHNK